MTDVLRYDSVTGHIGPNRPDVLGSQGAAEYAVTRLLAIAAIEFGFLRDAREAEYGGQYDLLEDGDDPKQVDESILPEDLVELVEILNGTLPEPLTDTDREIIQAFLNGRSRPVIVAGQDYLPLNAAAEE